MKYLIVMLAACSLISCSSNRASGIKNTTKLPDTYQCTYAKEVCDEAQEYEAKYQKMNDDEKKDFKTILITYRSQCASALDQCYKSGEIDK